ncbi:unnamed protein product [Psylliodes chrysocephalus]|uniref:Uncharacterized protein n=1 Tax=Psylliodes chrysocephalus TaxID=3402493 RepID=A0A9P0CJ62_9CUCU|nr:unnamed protein product [Psylliodes chrysocephala]
MVSQCKLKCTSKFNDEEKQLIFSKLYNGKPKNAEDTFLQDLMETKAIVRRRKRVADGDELNAKPRTAHFQYFVQKIEEQVPVCKQAFLNLYAISHFRVQRLNMLLSKGESPKDMRGKHNTRPTSVTAETRTKMQMHIDSFPYKISHYGERH